MPNMPRDAHNFLNGCAFCSRNVSGTRSPFEDCILTEIYYVFNRQLLLIIVRRFPLSSRCFSPFLPLSVFHFTHFFSSNPCFLCTRFFFSPLNMESTAERSKFA